MEITYSWKITELIKTPLLNGVEDVIISIKFDYIGTSDQIGEDGEFKASTFKGAVPTPPPNSENFKPLLDLTEEEVINWIKALHPVDHMQEQIIKDLEKNIEERININNLPWVVK